MLYVSSMDWYQQRVLCRCVWMEDGGNCVTVVGDIKRHLLCVDNWDCLLLASVTQCNDSIHVPVWLNISFLTILAAIGEPCISLCQQNCNFYGTHYLNTATTNANFGPKSLAPLYSNFRCYGNESSLMNCSYSSTVCAYYGRTDAAVRCLGDIVSGNTWSNINCLLHVLLL